MKVCIVGCGAVGSLFAANLATLDDVEVWAYDLAQEHVDAINRDGLRLTGMSEFAGLDGDLPSRFFLEQRDESFIQRNREIRRRGSDKAGSPPLAGIAVECELRYHKKRTLRFCQIPIHLPLVVGEHSKPEDLLGHPGQLRVGIGRREAGEHEKAGPDCPGNPAFDPNLRASNPLEDDSHSTVTLLARFLGWSTLQPRRTAM